MKDLKDLLERFMNLDKAKDKNKTSKVSRDDPDWQLFQERGGEAGRDSEKLLAVSAPSSTNGKRGRVNG